MRVVDAREQAKRLDEPSGVALMSEGLLEHRNIMSKSSELSHIAGVDTAVRRVRTLVMARIPIRAVVTGSTMKMKRTWHVERTY